MEARRTVPNKGELTTKLKPIFREHVVRYFYKQEPLYEIDPIPAEFDQIILSLYSILPLEDVKANFIESFGKPALSYDQKFWIFKTDVGKFEVSSSRENTNCYHIIKLRNLELLPLLAPVFARFPLKKCGKPPIAIASTELKFDLPLPFDFFSYAKAVRILGHLNLFLIPRKNRYAGLSIISGNKFEKKVMIRLVERLLTITAD